MNKKINYGWNVLMFVASAIQLSVLIAERKSK